MAFVVRNDFAHVRDVVFLVLAGILLGILLEDLDDLTTTEEGEWITRSRYSNMIYLS